LSGRGFSRILASGLFSDITLGDHTNKYCSLKKMHIDWAALAKELDCESRGGTKYARGALSSLLGDDAIREAVDYYISGRSGAGLARSVLWHIHPRVGIEYCYQIFKEETDLDRRRSAVELLRVVADESALKWVPEFLDDPDEGIQAWGAGVVDQLLWSGFIYEVDCRDILYSMQTHENSAVKERFEFISEFLADRKGSEQDGGGQAATRSELA
jgi:hypothetical protein